MVLYLLFSPLLLPASLAIDGRAGTLRALWLETTKGIVSYLLVLPLFVFLWSIVPAGHDPTSFFVHHLLTLSLVPLMISFLLALVALRLLPTDLEPSVRLYAFLGGFFFAVALTELIRGDGYLDPLQLFLLPSHRLLFILIAPWIVALLRGSPPSSPILLWPLLLLCLLVPMFTTRLYERGYTLLAILLLVALFLWVTITWVISARR